MNAFAENPFLFFVDKVPSIFTVDIPKSTRKIVELLDTGCDARVPVTAIPTNTNRYIFSKSPKTKSNEGCRSYSEGKPENKFNRERFRAQSGRNAMPAEKSYFTTKEDENVHEHHGRKYFQYDDNDDAALSTDFRVNSRISPEKMKTHPWNHDLYETQPNHREHDLVSPNFQNHTSIPREDRPQQTGKGVKTNGVRPSSARSNYPKADSRIYDQKILADRERTETLLLDYPDSFEYEEPSQSSSAKDHRQRLKTFTYEDAENPIDRNNYRSSRSTSRNMQTASSVKQNDSSRQWEETQSSRIRSRTCSPPANRQKRTRSVIKSFGEDVDHVQDRYDTQNSRDSVDTGNTRAACNESPTLTRSTEKLKKFVDRAVDKDSLSDVLKSSINNNCLPRSIQMSATDEDKTTGGFDFWEFIPLDENGKKCVKTSGKIASLLQQRIYSGSRSYPQTRHVADERKDINPKIYRRIGQKSATEQYSARSTLGVPNTTSLDNSSPSLRPQSARVSMKSEINPSSDSPPLEQSTKSFDSHARKISSAGSRIPKYFPEKLRSQEQSKQYKNQSKVESKFGFGWHGKTSQYLKRPNSSTSESNADKKKKTLENGHSEVGTDKKAGMSFVEKTAACLKRKLEKKMAEVSPNQRSAAITEKKIRSEGSTYSRLPIRIESCLKSKYPAVLGTSGDTKSQPPHKEQSKIDGPTEDPNTQQSSVRSRTKPKVKQTVMQNKVVVAPVTVSMNSAPIEKVQVTLTKDSYQEKGDSKLVNAVVGGLIENKSRERNSPKNEKLGINVEDLKVLNAEQDQRKRDLLSRSCGKEVNRRSNLLKEVNAGVKSDFKEKCFFHLNDESLTCNNYCNKNHKNINSFRSDRSMTIRSRF